MPANAGQVSSNRSFSKGAAAGIIIAAVGFGLLTGIGMGCAILRCYTIYLHCRQGELELQCMELALCQDISPVTSFLQEATILSVQNIMQSIQSINAEQCLAGSTRLSNSPRTA